MIGSVWNYLKKDEIMQQTTIRTAQEVKADFFRKGISVASWAKKNNFDSVTVHQVLNGTNAGSRGVGHKIAVTLGIKDGEITEV
jgi:gp16 family phage-associated protein